MSTPAPPSTLSIAPFGVRVLALIVSSPAPVEIESPNAPPTTASSPDPVARVICSILAIEVRPAAAIAVVILMERLDARTLE